MYDFSAEPGNNELTVNEGEIITITNPVRELLRLNWSLKDLEVNLKPICRYLGSLVSFLPLPH